MKHPKILALVLAGGEGNRMQQLTEQRAKPALPFAGVYRLIDFPLSNCVHSQIENVWVVEQFETHSLNEHLTNGRPWDLDRTHGGLQILPPHKGSGEDGWHQGNADAIYRNRRFIQKFNPDLLLVLSADHIYTLDYRDVIEAHLETGADVTMVTTEVDPQEAVRFGNVDVDASRRVTRFDYKPDEPASDIATTEVFVYTQSTLMAVLDELIDGAKTEADNPEDAALEDFGHELLPALVERGRAYAFPLDGYWRDAGTIESYFAAHMDLLQNESPLRLDNPQWPILTRDTQRLPARIAASAHIDNALISPGWTIQGTVRNAVLSPGVVIENGATVEDAVLLHSV
ncbi:MAG: glucose-phosphate adenylyltransferase, partial [Abditibacteriota bacterium]|nr:glucose-phosphate adenylyltransferase [Abditibacteriota bacterium]